MAGLTGATLSGVDGVADGLGLALGEPVADALVCPDALLDGRVSNKRTAAIVIGRNA